MQLGVDSLAAGQLVIEFSIAEVPGSFLMISGGCRQILGKRVKSIDTTDIHRLRAAQGWLELGSATEAAAELENIPREAQDHPAVLEMRWQIHVKELNWDGAKEIAQAIVSLIPDEPDGWLHLSYATRRATGGGIQAAWDVLFPTAKKFPGVSLISYNLACYACQLGQLDLAREWLRKAFVAGETTKYRMMALQDSDLEPLWKEIVEM